MTLSIISTLWGVLIQPVHTYRSLKNTSPRECGIYFFWLLCIFALGRIVLAVTGVEDSYLITGAPVAFVFVLIIIIVGYIFLFFDAYIINYTASLVGGNTPKHSVFRVLAYSATPALLFGGIPVIGFIGIIYTVILEFIGLRELVELSLSKSVLVLVMSIIATLIVTLVYSGVPYYIAAPSLLIEIGYYALGVILFIIVIKSLWREIVRDAL